MNCIKGEIMIDVERIISKIDELNEIDSQRRVFASDSHQYKFNTCLAEVELSQFEEKHGIRLPDDYKEFLLKVGNGGAGPGYGVLPLNQFYHIGKWARRICKMFYGGSFELDDVDPKFLSNPFPHIQKWGDDPDQELDEEKEVGREDYIKQFNYDIQGSIALCDHGCGLHNILIVSGPERGKVWYEFRNENHGMGPINNSFIEWYVNWLDTSIKETKAFWDIRDMMVGKVKGVITFGYGREITVELTHNKKQITFSYCQTDEFIEKGKVSQKIKPDDMIHFSLFIDNVIPELVNCENSVQMENVLTQYSICSTVQRIIDKKSFLCPLDGYEKSIMVKTPKEIDLQIGSKIKVTGTIKAELYKVERNKISEGNQSIFNAIKRFWFK